MKGERRRCAEGGCVCRHEGREEKVCRMRRRRVYRNEEGDEEEEGVRALCVMSGTSFNGEQVTWLW